MKKYKKIIGLMTLTFGFLLFMPNTKAWTLNPTEYYKYSYFGKIVNNENNETIYFENSDKVVELEKLYTLEESDEIGSKIHNDFYDWLYENNAMVSSWGGNIDYNSTIIYEFNGTEYTDYDELENAIDTYLETKEDYSILTEEEKEEYLVDIKETNNIFYNINVNIPKREAINEIKLSSINTDTTIGEKPKFKATLEDDGKIYTLKYLEWFDDEFKSVCGLNDSVLNDECFNNLTTFEEGRSYTLTLYIEINDIDKYRFSNDIIVYIDGKEFDGEVVIDQANSLLYVNVLDGVKQSLIKHAAEVLDIEADDKNNNTLNNAVDIIKKMIAEYTFGFNELNGMSEELVDEIFDALRDSKTITIDLTSENNSNVSDELKDKVNNTINDNINGFSILNFYDINLIVKIDNVKLADSIHELDGEIEVNLDINDFVSKLPALNSARTREFKVLRIHNGKVDILDATYNNGILSFKTDRFSDYVVVYKDTINSSNPKTSDNIIVYMVIGVISIIGLMTTIMINKINQG